MYIIEPVGAGKVVGGGPSEHYLQYTSECKKKENIYLTVNLSLKLTEGSREQRYGAVTADLVFTFLGYYVSDCVC